MVGCFFKLSLNYWLARVKNIQNETENWYADTAFISEFHDYQKVLGRQKWDPLRKSVRKSVNGALPIKALKLWKTARAEGNGCSRVPSDHIMSTYSPCRCWRNAWMSGQVTRLTLLFPNPSPNEPIMRENRNMLLWPIVVKNAFFWTPQCPAGQPSALYQSRIRKCQKSLCSFFSQKPWKVALIFTFDN